MEQKKWYESKVALFNILMALAAIVVIVSPAAGAAMQGIVQQYFGEAGLAWALINLVLRVLKSNVVL
jgi:hypothetical protein